MSMFRCHGREARTRGIDCDVCGVGLTAGGDLLEPEVGVVAAVANRLVVSSADHLCVAQRFQDAAIKGAHSGHALSGDIDKNVVDSHGGGCGRRMRSRRDGRAEGERLVLRQSPA